MSYSFFNFFRKSIKLEEKKIRDQETTDSLNSILNRARSVTVGTSFGGITELMMRKNDGTVVWTPLQPVEVVELIHQLAANVGCHIIVKPREDFASWRQWNENAQSLSFVEDTKQKLENHSHDDVEPFNKVGVNLEHEDLLAGTNLSNKVEIKY